MTEPLVSMRRLTEDEVVTIVTGDLRMRGEPAHEKELAALIQWVEETLVAAAIVQCLAEGTLRGTMRDDGRPRFMKVPRGRPPKVEPPPRLPVAGITPQEVLAALKGYGRPAGVCVRCGRPAKVCGAPDCRALYAEARPPP